MTRIMTTQGERAALERAGQVKTFSTASAILVQHHRKPEGFLLKLFIWIYHPNIKSCLIWENTPVHSLGFRHQFRMAMSEGWIG